MKKIALYAALLLSVVAIAAQGQNNKTFRSHLTTKVDVFADLWQDTPEALDLKAFNRGVNIATTYNFPIKNSSLSFDIGAGLGIHNMYHENTFEKNNEGIVQFGQIPDTVSGGGDVDVDNAKLSFTYLDVPMEFKIETETNLRAAIGFKVGMLINSLSKYKGTNFMDDESGDVKIKEKDLPNTNRFRYGPTVRLGYKWINLYGYYSISTLFEENQGPEMYPVSIGISIVKF